jgi:hypothetical protein
MILVSEGILLCNEGTLLTLLVIFFFLLLLLLLLRILWLSGPF